MPKEITDIKKFLQIAKVDDKGDKGDKGKGKKGAEKRNLYIKHGKKITKFKLRGARYLYTFQTADQDKAQKLQQSLPNMDMNLKILKIFFILASISLILASEASTNKKKVLVIIDNLAIESTHSIFLNDLKSKGYEVTTKMINSHNNKIKEYGEFLYDNIIVFCTSEPEPIQIKASQLLEFFDQGNNLFIAGDIDTSKIYRQLFNHLGAELDQIGSQIVDHFSNANPSDHSMILTKNIVAGQPFLQQNIVKPILYRGIGMTLTNYENQLVYSLLRGSEYTYSQKYDDQKQTLNMGNSIVLAAAIQGRNNARAVMTGSLDMFSNEFYQNNKADNQKFGQDLVSWAFQENGVLRVGNVFHHKTGEQNQPFEYKVYDDIEFEIEIEQFDKSKNQWVPYITNDLMLEFVMLDPYVRMFLTKDTSAAQNSLYKASFKAPHQYGVFQFKVVYRKPGYSFIDSATKIPVRPFKHNEYERYLFRAYPYYIGVFGTIFAFVIFFAYLLWDSSSFTKQKQE